MSVELTRNEKRFRDISLSFSPHPLTGDITVLKDERAINASLKNIIFIGLGQKLFNHKFGTQISRMLFDMVDEVSAASLKLEIERSIKFNEPRVDLEKVIVEAKPDNNTFAITIEYYISGYDKVFNFNTILTPTR